MKTSTKNPSKKLIMVHNHQTNSKIGRNNGFGTECKYVSLLPQDYIHRPDLPQHTV